MKQHKAVLREVRDSSSDTEEFIREAFDRNFDRLRFESGHSLSPEVKEAALQQVLFYWRRLREVAERITETEVKLNLPGQKTPKGRKFGIEGVVDIVRENDRVILYDLKTHDQESVRANLADYEKQLNVYAHIWQNLRRQQLDQTAIIATSLPDSVKEAIETNDPDQLAKALANWNPVIDIPADSRHIDETIHDFGKVVDNIEEGRFAPPPVRQLKRRETRHETFATRSCRNCDARFSCDSWRSARSSIRALILKSSP
jgi:hypothetical protein